MRAKEIALFGILGGVMYAAKAAMAYLPNIEPVSLIVMVYSLSLGRRALYPIYAYVALELFTSGLHFWSINYLYIWAILFSSVRLFRFMESTLFWAILSGAFGLCFGLLCAPIYLLCGGFTFALDWWIVGIPWDIAHGIGNFTLAMALFRPLEKIMKGLVEGGNENRID